MKKAKMIAYRLPNSYSLILGSTILAVVIIGQLWSFYNYSIIGERYWNFIHTIAAEDIEKIEFYNFEKGIEGNLIVSVEDYQTIQTITNYFSNSISYSSSHPVYVQKAYAVFHLKNGKKFEFELNLMANPDKIVYLSFVKKWKNTTSYFGEAQINDVNFTDFLLSVDVFNNK